MTVIPESELFLTDDWKIYRDAVYGIEMKYPKNWYTLKNEQGISFSTSPTASAYDFNKNGEVITYGDWARVTATIELKSTAKTLEDWLKMRVKNFGPGVDYAVQYAIIGNKKFIGTFPFSETGWKNAYFEIKDDNILKLVFITNARYLSADYSKIFYTMINSLKY